MPLSPKLKKQFDTISKKKFPIIIDGKKYNEDYFNRLLETYRKVMGYADIRNQIIQECLSKVSERKEEELYVTKKCVIKHYGVLFKDNDKMTGPQYKRLLGNKIEKEFSTLKKQYPKQNIIFMATTREAPFSVGDFTHYTSIVVSYCHKKTANNPCLKNTNCDEVFHFDSDPYYLDEDRGNWAKVSIPVLRNFANKHKMNFTRFNPQCQIEEHYFCQTWSMLFLESLLCGGPVLNKLTGKRIKFKESRKFITKEVVRMYKRFTKEIIEEYNENYEDKKDKLPDIILNNMEKFIDYNYKYNFDEFVRDDSTFKDDIADDLKEIIEKPQSKKDMEIDLHNYMMNDINSSDGRHPADHMIALNWIKEDVLVDKSDKKIIDKLIRDLENNVFGK